jgi:hypothetical protein
MKYDSNCNLIDELDKQICDLQHIIEFIPFDIQRGYRLAKQQS